MRKLIGLSAAMLEMAVLMVSAKCGAHDSVSMYLLSVQMQRPSRNGDTW